MHFKRTIVISAVFFLSIVNAAHADIQVFAFVDNQTSSSVLLNGAETSGTFNTGPASSVAANTRTAAAVTFTFGLHEEGAVSYGPCDMDWDVTSRFGFYDFYTSVGTYGTGCAATVLGQYYIFPDVVWVFVELDIT